MKVITINNTNRYIIIFNVLENNMELFSNTFYFYIKNMK